MRPPAVPNADRRFFRSYFFPARNQPAAPDERSERNDSIWALVAGTVKAFCLPIDYVLYDMSYVNMIMYGAVLPSYNPKKDRKKGEEIIKADDPANRDKVRRFFDSIS